MSTPLNGSILKGFEILGLFSRERPEIAAATVMAELGMNAATAHRFLATLEEAGVIVAVRRGFYRLGHLAAEIGRLAEDTNPLVQQVQPDLEALAARLSESVMLCRLGRRGPVSIAVGTAMRSFTMSFRVGEVLHLLTSAQGRLWLADMEPAAREKAVVQSATDPDAALAQLARIAPELAAIRAAGVAHNTGSAEPDVGALAVPVRAGGQPQGEMVLSLSVFGPLNRITPDFRETAAPQLFATARDIGQKIRK